VQNNERLKGAKKLTLFCFTRTVMQILSKVRNFLLHSHLLTRLGTNSSSKLLV